MVKRLFVSGLTSFTSEETVRKYFEQFGELYECVVPPPPRYEIFDEGPDDESIEKRSAIRFEKANDNKILNSELEVIPYQQKIHNNFEKYMRIIGSEEGYKSTPKKCSAGYAYITFVFAEGFQNCMKRDEHKIDGVNCTIELARSLETFKVESKRLFVSFFPLKKLTSNELKETFGQFGKLTDVEFVSDTEGPLYFCIITFTTSEAVDECIKKRHFVQGVQLFVRRAVLREAIKLAEQKGKEISNSHSFIGYSPQIPSFAVQKSNFKINDVISQAKFNSCFEFDPSAAAGYAQIIGPQPQQTTSNDELLSNYGYGPRKW